jgi:hypothetical protein
MAVPYVPPQVKEIVAHEASIADLKNYRLVSRELKEIADREILQRYRKIHRPDSLYSQEAALSIGHMIRYLTLLENEVVNPAVAAGPNGSPAQIEFLSRELLWALDYPRLRYLLERGADVNYEGVAEHIVMEYNVASDSRQRQNPAVIEEALIMVAICLKYGMVIPTDVPARDALEQIRSRFHAYLPEFSFDPRHWPEYVSMDF